MTLFHSIFVVVRSAVRVVSSPGYVIKVASGCDADTVGIGFLRSIIDYDSRICDGAIGWDVLNLLEGQDMYGVCAGCVCFGVTLC